MNTYTPHRPSHWHLPLIDGARGYLIFAMTIGHISALTGFRELNYITHKLWAVFLTGEGFMTISGFMCGYILTLRMPKTGFWGSVRWGLARAWKIIRYYLLALALCALPSFIWPLHETMAGTLFHGRLHIGFEELALFATGLFRPSFYDILFVYVICIALAPIALRLLASRFGFLVWSLSVLGWLFTQYGFTEDVLIRLYDRIPQVSGGETGAFHFFAWQMLFFGALALGRLFALDREALLALLHQAHPQLLRFALVLLAFFAAPNLLAASTGIFVHGHRYLSDYLMVAPLPLFNYLLAVFVICYLLNAPDMSQTWPARLLRAVLGWRVFQQIGRVTLQSFTASIVISYWIAYAIPFGAQVSLPFALGALALSLSVVYLTAWIETHRANKPRTPGQSG